MGTGKAIIVLGMHRSGTSALTRLLNLLGVDLGNRLLPAQDDNVTGFWEHMDIVSVHERLLGAFGLHWDDPVNLPDDWWLSETVVPFRQELIEIVDRDFHDSPLWGVKDPRLCRLLPLWIPVLKQTGHEPRFVILNRNPREIAESLAYRNGFPPGKSYLLWLQCTLDVERDTRKLKRVFVTYDELLNNWQVTADRISRGLSIEWPVDYRDVEDSINEFLVPGLRHHHTGDDDFLSDQRVHLWMREAYRVFVDASHRDLSAAARKKLTGLRTDLLEAESLFSAWHQSLRRDLTGVQGELNAALPRISSLELQIRDRDAQIRERDGWLEQRLQEIEDKDAQIRQLHAEVIDRQKLILERDEWLIQRVREIQERDTRLSEQESRLSEMAAELTGRDTLIQQQQQSLHETWQRIGVLEQEKAAILSSTSWKISYPVRLIGTLIKGGVHAARQLTVRVARALYHHLPLSLYRRQSLKSFFYRHLPVLFRHTESYRIWLPLQGEVASPVAHPEPVVAAEVDLNQGFAFQHVDDPLVSIVIPVYGKADYTYRCLRSIHETPPGTPCEIILVDDASPENMEDVLHAVQGLTMLRNHKNQGFIRSCNRGAQAARGQYILFLNNDVEVLPGWLDELVRTFELKPDAGLVGSRLIYPDGRLQEAGGIIWNNASGWNYGRLGDPERPEFNYLREVDYCSGASIMVPAELLAEVGWFDERYVPAYAEDSDLAFKIRQAGSKVLYQPLSRIVHYEGITSGTDLSEGVKSYQTVNAGKFREKWRVELLSHGLPGMDPDIVKDRGARRRILVLDHCTPMPDHDAGSITILSIMKLFQDLSFKVTFIPEDNFLRLEKYTDDLQRIGIECLYAPYVTSVEQHLRDWGHLYDIVLMFRVSVATRNMDAVRKYCARAKTLFHISDLHYLREERRAALENSNQIARQALQTRETELGVVRSADCTIVHSTSERELLTREIGGVNIVVFPWVLEARGTDQTFDRREGIVFIGGYQHTPNVDAVLHFVRDVFPLIRGKLPGVRFYVVGSRPPPELRDLETDDIIVTGYVEDLEALLDERRLSVVPLRYGAGIKGKIGTSLGAGLPCVSTTVGVEGMGLENEREVLIADGPEDFAEAVVRLYRDADLWSSLSGNGVEFVNRNYSYEAGKGIIRTILDSIGITAALPDAADGTPDVNGHLYLTECTRQEEYEQLVHSSEFRDRIEYERELAREHNTEQEFQVPGYCSVCEKQVGFLVDRQSGAREVEGIWIPNWRERLVCPACGMNSRQRAIASVVATQIRQQICNGVTPRVYLMEQVTPIYRWLVRKFPGVEFIGSEYLSPDLASGTMKGEIRHEDVENLSFIDSSLDIVVSNDVLEHVNDPDRAIREVSRVLNERGRLFMTIPFDPRAGSNIRRAELVDGEVHHILPEVYHGNPVSTKGSLVFTDFGWEVLDQLSSAGFGSSKLVMYWSAEKGYLGGAQCYIDAIK